MSKQRNTRIQTSFGKTVSRGIWVFLVFINTIPVSGINESPQFSEQANLALRRTAHRLLAENGDTLSAIPPVEQSDPATFLIRVDSLFDYDKLPQLLQESLELQGIRQAYNVVIINCGDGKIQLGYSYLDLAREGGVPCQGRRQDAGCYLLKISFIPDRAEAAAGGKWWIISISGLLAAGIGLMVWRRSGKDLIISKQEAPAGDTARRTEFGNSALDLSGLLLHTGTGVHHLTYREAKLLNLFVNHKNQVLERDFILKSVWEDEGIIVGRSIDVFVSRLRKLLQDDASVKIAAVHGVGYRMEVESGIL